MKIDERLRKKEEVRKKINKDLRTRNALKFPDCIGKFPDDSCKNSTKDNPGEDCLKCPYY